MKRRAVGLLVAVAAILTLAVGWLAVSYPYVLHAFLRGRGNYTPTH